jgi:hypothetical protein
MNEAIKRKFEWLILQSTYLTLLIYKVLTYSGVAYYFMESFTKLNLPYSTVFAGTVLFILMHPKRILDDYFISHTRLVIFELLAPIMAFIAIILAKAIS